MKAGRLYLIPVPLGPSPLPDSLPEPVLARARGLKHFVAENAKTARAFIKALPCDSPLQQITIRELNEHTPANVLPELLSPALSGSDLGLISEAGCPAVADPGTALVSLAHRQGVQVVPMVGPCSLVLALMASGLSGQSFAFHGYLPSEAQERGKRLRELEKESRQQQRTQIFIETPYRNRQMLASLVNTCAPGTRICIATDLTLAEEQITTRPVADWRRQQLPEINRRPTVFLLQA
jgi:16S rRNA (cytidine1402-2'-O)-methyltransferase